MSNSVKQIISEAKKKAKVFRNEYLMPEHILDAALDTEKIKNVLSFCGANRNVLKKELLTYFKQKLPVLSEMIAEPVETIGYKNVFKRAEEDSLASGKTEIDMADVLVSLFDEKESFSSYCLKQAGVKRLKLLLVLSHGFNTGNSQRKQETEYLERYTVDLTALALKNKLEPLIGREKELARTIQILCRKKKCNPIYVGEAGVGKTAIAEGLAVKIVTGEVPAELHGFNIFSLDMGAIMAGTKYRGTFEKRLKRVTTEISKLEKAILFIDEIHTIVGTGSNNSLDAANILKPTLSSGKFYCIGATTYNEYNKYFEKDHALSRRFQKIEINEPSEEDTINILKGLKSQYEEHHNVVYTKESIQAVVKLSSLYITDRRQPDKAIDLIDEAGAYARVHKENTVDIPIIEQLISTFARIPEKSICENEKNKLQHLESNLKHKIFGQDNAISEVVQAVKQSRAGLRLNGKTVANFLFAGPSGVGKTALARQLAEILGIAMLRFDMSEYQEKHTVSRLIGAAPGYVGYEEGGQLTDAVRKQPHAVVLLDEIEKAHQDVYNILLQIMDYATLTDNQGRKADFRNVILIMTSNAGAREMGKGIIGFDNRIVGESAVYSALESIFSPELRGRLDAMIRFEHLSRKNIISIVRKELDILSVQLLEKNVTLTVTETCVDKLTEEGYSRDFGARNIERLIEKKIKTLFVDEILFGRLSGGGSANVDWRDGSYFMKIRKKPKTNFSSKQVIVEG